MTKLISHDKNNCIPRSSAEYILRNHWQLQDIYRQELIEDYFLLYWHPEYFLNELCCGQIVYGQRVFNIVYIDRKNPYWYRRNCRQVALSFREPIKKFDIHNVVLVKGID